MTEEKPRRAKRRAERGSDQSARAAEIEPVPAADIAQGARRQLSEITGLEPETVTSLEQYDDATWRVTVELLELSRIPQSDDVIGTYEADLDQSGQLISYRRIGRYPRSQAQQSQRIGS